MSASVATGNYQVPFEPTPTGDPSSAFNGIEIQSGRKWFPPPPGSSLALRCVVFSSVSCVDPGRGGGTWCGDPEAVLPLTVLLSVVHPSVSAARKQEIIKITEQLIEAINNGDFDAYT